MHLFNRNRVPRRAADGIVGAIILHRVGGVDWCTVRLFTSGGYLCSALRSFPRRGQALYRSLRGEPRFLEVELPRSDGVVSPHPSEGRDQKTDKQSCKNVWHG